MIIKGTEVSFYIPPTGIEVKLIDNNPKNGYVRDAVTLERLEYCILKDENGNKRYVHGPEVVFPTPTEVFIKDGSGNVKRKAIELSDVSGVYVKVIVDYKDENGEKHKTGDELFITGRDQMIYYPRPEHTFITYNGKIKHHAIAIPRGEGRYVMNRITGEIKTIKGPAMYLPDPRIEVVVKRTLNQLQCKLWYPNNKEVLAANGFFANEKSIEQNTMNVSCLDGVKFADFSMVPAESVYYNGTPMKQESNKINRSNTYTPPRTISLDNSKYEGAVTVDVWTEYAVNIISKDGKRQVVKGPQTVVLDYDQILEMIEVSNDTGLEKVVFLHHKNDRVNDIIEVETSDFVKTKLNISYQIGFDESFCENWFSISDYKKFLRDWCRRVLKKIVKERTITDFNTNYGSIILEGIKDSDADGYIHKFIENGMVIYDIEVLSVEIEDRIQEMLDNCQSEILSDTINLLAKQTSVDMEKQIKELETEKIRLNSELYYFKAKSNAELMAKELELKIADQKARDEENKRKHEIEAEIQILKNAVAEAEYDRLNKQREAERLYEEEKAELAMKREAHTAEAMKTILDAISPELAASMKAEGNREIVEAIASSISPYAIAQGESVSEAVNRLMRGTSFGDIMKDVMKNR